MDSFIQKIFEIDQESEQYKKLLEEKKNQLIQERKCQIEELDNMYQRALEEEKNNLSLRLTYLENQERKNLERYKDKAKTVRNLFTQKRENLVESIAKSILEGGD